MEIPTNLDSKFRFILVAAKRARQLQGGAKALIQTPMRKPTSVAQLEVGAGLVPVEYSLPLGLGEKYKKKPAK
jgi:DNA-directed RNA polymerase subunit omega